MQALLSSIKIDFNVGMKLEIVKGSYFMESIPKSLSDSRASIWCCL